MSDSVTELREVNKKLYNIMKAFQIAAEESGSLVFTYDTKTMTIFVDERTAAAFGVAVRQPGVPYDMVKRGIVSEDTAGEYLRIHEAIINGAMEAGGVVKLIQADGSESVHDLKFRAITDENGVPTGTAVGVYRNITDRYFKDMERERYRQVVYSSERFSFRYESDSDTLTIFSPPSKNGGNEEVSRFESFFPRMKAGEFCPKSDIIILKELFTKGAEKPVHVRLYRAGTGELRWYALTAKILDKGGYCRRVFGVISDITDVKEKEKAYNKLERVLSTMKYDYIGIFEIDLERDIYTALHYGAQDYFPLPDKGCFTETMRFMIINSSDADFHERFLRFADIGYLRGLLASERKAEFEYMTVFENRPWRRITYKAAEFRDGVPTALILYISDIDSIKTRELLQQQAVEEAYRCAEAASAAKTEFLSNMSHDIRTPMNAIIGMTAIAGVNIENRQRVQECLNKINSASRHLLALINEVLDMGKIESGTAELSESQFDLGDLIDNSVAMALPQINEKGHDLAVDAGGMKHEKVTGDSLCIQKIFINLISNAVKYTPAGGKIRITVNERHSHRHNYGEYEFVFEDNGIGMSEEFQKVLFEPFARASDVRSSGIIGTGLGMSITKNLVRLMGGDIRVSSAPGKGTRFTVTVPLKIREDSDELPEDLLNLPVLVADDDESSCESSCLLLDSIGMKGEWCLSGSEAVEKVSERHEAGDDYFAVILDWKMPGMDGVATAREIRRRVGPDIPIIFLTAYDWAEIEAEARAAGVDRFLSKPLFRSRLIGSFREIAGLRREETDENAPIFSEKAVFHGKRVLLAEDNELNAEIALELLSMTGISVERVLNGAEALSRAEGSAEGYYDLIFMDLQMPVMDGYSAAAAIRSLKREDMRRIPIVAMTANAMAEDVSRAVSSGMNAHIAKPVDFKRLESVLLKYLS